MSSYRAAEFFAGIGLVRSGLESAGIEVVYANDIERTKAALYASNFGSEHYVCDDVRKVRGEDMPAVELATASFPCTDLSLAGNRAGLAGSESSMFWEFARVLEEMPQRPRVVMLENVPSFLSSHGGADLRAVVLKLNDLGYYCDLLTVDARWFVPQSRPRLFVVGFDSPLNEAAEPVVSRVRPQAVAGFIGRHPDLKWQHAPLPNPPEVEPALESAMEALPNRDRRWWEAERVGRFVDSLSATQRVRLDDLVKARRYATAYRRTRQGKAVWEIRGDNIAGCLRTARGGSSKQAVVDTTTGKLRIRWMTAREYARLQGAPDFSLEGVSEVQAIFGFGDAVCVPAVGWIAQNYLAPLLSGDLTAELAVA